ncbi:hypothetical protein [Treponema pectinovorum]|uniref:hypothetical protein n=1 Tax=Treponema pectinovorum TaxID=164 RepID=UPI0011C7C14B|nr:hypothetical protein [Treponema pectinovorum]
MQIFKFIVACFFFGLTSYILGRLHEKILANRKGIRTNNQEYDDSAKRVNSVSKSVDTVQGGISNAGKSIKESIAILEKIKER